MKDCPIWMVAAFIIATLITAIVAPGLTREPRQLTLQSFGKSVEAISRKFDDSPVCGVIDPKMDSLILPEPVLHRIAGLFDDRRSICVELAFFVDRDVELREVSEFNFAQKTVLRWTCQ